MINKTAPLATSYQCPTAAAAMMTRLIWTINKTAVGSLFLLHYHWIPGSSGNPSGRISNRIDPRTSTAAIGVVAGCQITDATQTWRGHFGIGPHSQKRSGPWGWMLSHQPGEWRFVQTRREKLFYNQLALSIAPWNLSLTFGFSLLYPRILGIHHWGVFPNNPRCDAIVYLVGRPG